MTCGRTAKLNKIAKFKKFNDENQYKWFKYVMRAIMHSNSSN